MVDPTDAPATKRHAPKYIALAGYVLSCLVVAVGLHRVIGLDGAGLVGALVVVAAALLWYPFLPLFRRLHASTSE